MHYLCSVFTTREFTLNFPDQICNSPYCQPYNLHVSSENLVLDQLIIPKSIYFFLFSPLVCMILYKDSKEKFCLGHSRELKG